MNNIIVILFATLLTLEIFLPVFCKFMLLMGIVYQMKYPLIMMCRLVKINNSLEERGHARLQMSSITRPGLIAN